MTIEGIYIFLLVEAQEKDHTSLQDCFIYGPVPIRPLFLFLLRD